MSTIETPRQQVAPKDIPGALGELWRSCCEQEQGVEVSRALTLNFVAVVDAAREQQLRDSLRPMVGRLPCRAFVASLHSDRRHIAATVRGLARAQGRERHLLLEQIDLKVPDGEFELLAGVVRPLLVNDIPTHLYWDASWPDDLAEFRRLLRLADHIVVDSATFDDPGPRIADLEQLRGRGLRITDLAGLRVHPWQRALAEVFERTRYDRSQPTKISIRHRGHGVAASLLVARWLEQRLDAGVTLLGHDDGAAAGLDEEELRGEIAGIKLQNGDTEVVAEARHGRIHVEVTTAESCFLPYDVPQSRGRMIDLLAAAIDMS